MVNAIILEITDWTTNDLSIDEFFWTAILAAIIMSIVSMVLDFVLGSLVRHARRPPEPNGPLRGSFRALGGVRRQRSSMTRCRPAARAQASSPLSRWCQPSRISARRPRQDLTVRHGQPDRVQDERLRLRPSDPAVEGDQLLEGAALVEHGVVEAPDHDVRDVGNPSVRSRCRRALGEKRGERILALDAAVPEVGTVPAEGDRPPQSAKQPAHVRVRRSAG